jgi:hypothetical protein
MLPITIAPVWIKDSRLDHLPPSKSGGCCVGQSPGANRLRWV